MAVTNCLQHTYLCYYTIINIAKSDNTGTAADIAGSEMMLKLMFTIFKKFSLTLEPGYLELLNSLENFPVPIFRPHYHRHNKC